MISRIYIPDIARTARKAGYDPISVLAIIEVESAGILFTPVHGRQEPLIRFEGHYFDRRLSGSKRERARREGLASPQAGAIGNPRSQIARYRILRRAEAIDRKAARESCSWGVGQVMGAHWAWLGYKTIDTFVETARSGISGQMELMFQYMDKAGLKQTIARKDWSAFARRYNGPDYTRNRYHTRIARAYAKYSKLDLTGTGTEPTDDSLDDGETVTFPILIKQGMRGQKVERLQRRLSALGYPLRPDGIFGQRTFSAVMAFQQDHDLVPDGIVGGKTTAVLENATPLKTGWKLIRSWFEAIWSSGKHFVDLS